MVVGWSSKTRNRLIAMFWLFAGLYLLVACRLFSLQVMQQKKFGDIAKAQQEGEIEIPALRGDIRDRNNIVLATSLSLYSIAMNPREVKDPEATALALSQVLGRPKAELDKILSSGATFAWAKRKVEDKVADQVRELALPGVFLLKEQTGQRFYPKGRLLGTLLGATGTDDQGLDGFEATYDHTLAGKVGLAQVFLDRDGYTMPDTAMLIRPPHEGHSVVLTIDETIQYVAQRELSKCVKESHAKGGVCLVMDIKTGEMLAWAVAPDFPADKFSQVPAELRRNRAITDPYEPGSTFKVFSIASAIEAGVSPDDVFPSGGVISIGGWTIHNADDGLDAAGMETVTNILTYSFNVGTANIALKMGRNTVGKGLEAFGFGHLTGIDLMGESEGIINPYKGWADIDLATTSFGQSVGVTPIQLVSAMQSIANNGVRLRPHVVKAVVDSEGNVVKRFEPVEINRPISADTARKVRTILLNVCEKGTGKRARIPGYQIGGKTGTAQVVDHGVYASGKYTASFLGIAPVDNPRIVCLVKIEEPYPVFWGGVVAAPVFHNVVKESLWKLGVRPNQPIVEDEQQP